MSAKTTMVETTMVETTMEKESRGSSAVEGYTLAFDTCSKRISFCLWERDEVCLRWSSQDGEVWAEDLPFLLAQKIATKEAMAKKGEKLSQAFSYRLLRRLCFVRGPGSYTGLRACLSVARGFRLACSGRETGLDLYSATSFEAGLLSAGVRVRGEGYVLSLVESFRGVWYGQAFREGVALGNACVVGDDALRLWVFELLEMGEGRLTLCGGDVERACAEVLGSFPRESFVVWGGGDACDFSRPLVAGERTIYARGEKALQPVYMRAPL